MCHLLSPLLCSQLLLLLATSAPAEEPLRINGPTMGSYYSVVIDTPGQASQKQLQQDIEAIFARISSMMSTWDNNSEISRFNASDTCNWFPVSPEFAFVAAEALRVHELTEGSLDVTIAPLIDAWGFGSSGKKTIPPPEVIQTALRKIGSRHLQVRNDPPAIRRCVPGLQISLNSLAPGYAADLVSELLRARGLERHVVDVGGEIHAGRCKLNGAPWRLGVESPLGGLHTAVEMTDSSIATSGDYRNFFIINDRRYAHVLDPRSGYPVEDPPASVSVIHASAMTADAIATGMMVLGPQRGLQIARRQKLDVMFLVVHKDGSMEEFSVGRFADSEQPATPDQPSPKNSD